MFQRHWWSVTGVAIVSLVFLMLASPVASQPPTVQEQAMVIEGRVQWVGFGGQAMLLSPADGSAPIMIDLHGNRQSDYHGSAAPSSCESWLHSPAKPSDPGI